MKKVLALVLALAMVLSVVACSGSTTSTATTTEETTTETTTETAAVVENTDKNVESTVTGISDDAILKVAVDGEPDSLFPAQQQNKADNRVNSSMFNYLVEWDDTEKVAKPSLATSWEWLDDTYTKIEFTLRDDVYFSNGELMVAEDVAKSLEYGIANHATYMSMLDPENFEVVDDTHVIIATNKPYSNLVDILGCDYYTIFDWSAFEADGCDYTKWMRDPVGSGPYVLTEWVDGDHITLTRNENYWDKDNMPYYKQIIYYFISDQAARTDALKAGNVDVAYNLANNQIAELQAAGLTVNPYNQNVVKPLSFNMKSNPALADENVRKAILYCYDKAELADADGYGYEMYGNNPFVCANSSYYYDCETFTYDLTVAKEAMDTAIAEHGWTAEDLTFTTWAVAGSDTSQVQYLKAMLAEIGITLNIEEADFATVLFDHLFVGDTSISIGENDCWDVIRMLNCVDSRIDTSYDGYIDPYHEGNEEELHTLLDAAWASGSVEDYQAVMQFCADHYVVTVACSCLLTDAWNANITGMKYDAHCWPNVWDMRPVA